MLTVVLVILFLVALTSFYVAAEFAAVAVRTVRIQAMAEAGNRTATALLPYLKDSAALDRYVAACQIGITLSSLILGAYGQTNLTRYFKALFEGQEWIPAHYAAPAALGLVLLLLTGFHVVLGELLPKAIALRYPERVALALTYPMILSLWLYSLAIRFLNGTGTLILKSMGVPVHGHRHVHSPEELAQLVRRGSQSGTLAVEESRLLEQALHFGERQAREVMVPRTQVVGIDLNLDIDALMEQICQARQSRLPAFRGSLDEIQGILHVKDLVGMAPPLNLEALLKPPLSLPYSVTLQAAFDQMRIQRTQLVLLIDEYGGLAGVLSMEDVIEQLVGDIRDEFDSREARLRVVAGGWVARGEVSLREVASASGADMELPPGFSTVGGLLLDRLGRKPAVGDVVKFAGLSFEVLQVQGTRVVRVRIRVGSAS